MKPPKLVKTVRAELGITQLALAQKMGVHERTVRKWESGERQPRAAHLDLLWDVHLNGADMFDVKRVVEAGE